MSNGGYVFPQTREMIRSGLSLRDYFAGQALSACLTAAIEIEVSGGKLEKDAVLLASEMAYLAADTMLKVRGE